MNPRQSVLIAMFLGLAIWALGNANTTTIGTHVTDLKQVRK